MVKEEESDDLVIKMRGLPWSATVDDIFSFLEGVKIRNGRAGVHLTMSKEGRPSGEAFVEFESTEDRDKALEKDKQHMGHRYIEMFKTTQDDMDWYMSRSGLNVENIVDECCIRLRGLPYGCTKNDIIEFFSGLAIVPNGISFVSDQTGRHTGEAYVQFVSKEMVESALKKHLDRIGHRYIEIFRSSLAEINAQTGPKIRPLMSEFVPRPSPYDRGDRFGGSNRLGGRNSMSARFRITDYTEGDNWCGGNTWEGNARNFGGGIRDVNVGTPFLTKGKLSPPPAVRARNSIYGNGQSNWEEEQKFIVHMRGLPFRATEQDIVEFFQPVVPINVCIIFDRSGRASGEADAEFQTYDEANSAMAKDKQHMSSRYIELFLKAKPLPLTRTFGNFSSRNFANDRNVLNFEDGGSTNSLFSRRSGPPGGGGGGIVSNSAYDGFYGTSTYRSAAAAGGNNYTR